MNKVDNTQMNKQICPHCKMDISIRNPSGFCDHLYYPDSCKICKYCLPCEYYNKPCKNPDVCPIGNFDTFDK